MARIPAPVCKPSTCWNYADGNYIIAGLVLEAAAGQSLDALVQSRLLAPLDDGLAWTQVTEAAAWSARDEAGVVVFHDELYMVGTQGKADVWRSSNGKDWTQLTPEAGWKPRHDYGRVVFDGKLWVFAGWAGRSTNAMNDVWYSSDGVTWNRQAEHAPWAPRGPVAIVFRDKIWIYSGKHTGADDSWGGDLWQMTATALAA